MGKSTKVALGYAAISLFCYFAASFAQVNLFGLRPEIVFPLLGLVAFPLIFVIASRAGYFEGLRIQQISRMDKSTKVGLGYAAISLFCYFAASVALVNLFGLRPDLVLLLLGVVAFPITAVLASRAGYSEGRRSREPMI